MNSVYASFDTILLGYLVGLLRFEGIDAEIRNQYSAGALGELPPSEVMPEIWVDKSKLSLAREIIDEAIKSGNHHVLPGWVCPECGENIEGQFSQCWKCGHVKD